MCPKLARITCAMPSFATGGQVVFRPPQINSLFGISESWNGRKTQIKKMFVQGVFLSFLSFFFSKPQQYAYLFNSWSVEQKWFEMILRNLLRVPHFPLTMLSKHCSKNQFKVYWCNILELPELSLTLCYDYAWLINFRRYFHYLYFLTPVQFVKKKKMIKNHRPWKLIYHSTGMYHR